MTAGKKRLGLGLMVLVMGAVSALGLAAPAGAQVVEAARAALPDGIRASGVLKVATSLAWAPFAYKTEAGETAGLDIDIVNALAARLGVKPEFADLKFPTIIPGVQSGRYDIGVDQFAITPDRRKAVDFVPYITGHSGLLVRQGNEGLTINDLCGKELSLTQGSSQIDTATALSKKCQAEGKPEIKFTYYPDSAATYMAVANGRGDGFITGRAVGEWISRINPKMKMSMTKETLADEPYSASGIVMTKENTALRKALEAALLSMVADGTYMKLLEKYGVPDSALTVDQITHSPI
ncbi:MAG TPA: ABC transporter substrate-binding protein [Bordetella sp.]